MGILIPFTGISQLLPPLQAEQDCFNALAVCQDTFIQPAAYQGAGNLANEINGGTSCLTGGEFNGVWYTFTIQTGGVLSFTLTPSDLLDDFNWALYNLSNASCAEIATTPALEVACNNAAIAGATGMGAPGTGAFSPGIVVIAGETYVLNVSNFSGSSSGHMLDFSASSATILDTIPPQLCRLLFQTVEVIPLEFPLMKMLLVLLFSLQILPLQAREDLIRLPMYWEVIVSKEAHSNKTFR